MDVIDVIGEIYNETLRPYLPAKIGIYYTVPVKDKKLFDINDNNSGHKYELLSNLERYTETGDDVLVFGGGRGVASVVAARRVLPTGSVTVYEAAKEQCQRTQQTVNFNSVESFVSIEQAIVGSAVDVWGDQSDAITLAPSDLPHSDVWVLDLEGGSISFLESAVSEDISWPRVILIETHPDLGASVDAVQSTLENGPDIVDSIVHEVGDNTTDIGGDVVLVEIQQQNND